MKRLLVLFAVLVPLTLLIAGCGGGQGGSPPKTLPIDSKEKKAMMEKMLKEQAPPAPGAPGQGGKK